MKIKYVEKLRLNPTNRERLVIINSIIEEYRLQGYRLTLRQLYYQLVSRDIIANKQSEYSKLSLLLTKGRMAGVVDWDAIEDRLRKPEKPASWNSPKEILEIAADQYRCDRMEGQDVHIEVWVEKDALSGVLKRVTHKYGVNLMVNRGYSSTSAMHDSYKRFEGAKEEGKRIVILYLGDHDPSGIDMVRDIQDRISTFWGYEPDEDEFEVRRIALTMDQIDDHCPPPNPAKLTDPRADWYVKKFGQMSWEVDALTPQSLNEIIVDNICELIDSDKYDAVLEKEEIEKEKLLEFSKDFGADE